MIVTDSTALQRLSRFIAEVEFHPAPGSIDIIRDALIDTYGCMLIGAGQAVAQKTRLALQNTGQIHAHASACIYGTGLRAHPGAAAMANAIAGHALEYDDWEVPGNTHVSVVLMPAILAAGSHMALPGKAVLDAYLAGYETIARIGEAINLEHYDRGWHATATIGAIGAAAAVARLLALNPEQTLHALAIATSRALGFNAQFGSEAKPIQVGFAVDGGIIAAQLAATGLTGQAHMLEHATGMVKLMSHGEVGRIETAMGRIGKPLAIDEYQIVFKPWPCCGYTHRIMTGMLELFGDGIDIDSIDAIELHLPDMHAGILPFRQPLNRSEALFSLPYCASMVLLHGNLTCGDIDNETWRQDDIRDLIPKISVHAFKPNRPELNYDPEQPDRIVVHSQGNSRSIEIPYPLGAPQNPMSDTQHFRKFQINSGLDDSNAKRSWRQLRCWPEAADVHQLFTALPA
jgi:2-methylcitrate dehydratase PrpD